MIRPVHTEDATTICNIYNRYIDDTWITFEEIRVKPDEMAARIERITVNFPWLVYEENGLVLGYAYAGQWKERLAYRHTIEIAIYLDQQQTGKGIGTKLIGKLLELLRRQSYHSAIYGVSLPNAASVALCEKFGFRKIAHFHEVGYKLGKWIDVGYWELILK